ncbi:hypothetical protein M3Y94_00095500 [Aphelenchoides besseyi]|nr:hypothetical protein M3Y94_00095500 [Aphelenchoides besseyi]
MSRQFFCWSSVFFFVFPFCSPFKSTSFRIVLTFFEQRWPTLRRGLTTASSITSMIFIFLSLHKHSFLFGVLIVLNFMVVRRLARVQNANNLETQRPSTCSTQIQETFPPLLSPNDTQQFNFDRKSSSVAEKRFSLSIGHYDLHSLMPSRTSRRTNSAVRAAVYTMVGIVSSYLISNTLHLILTILERSKVQILQDPNDPDLASPFHTAFSDIVSFVYMFTSSIRILIIIACNPVIRVEILQRFHNFILKCKRTPIKQLTNGTAL